LLAPNGEHVTLDPPAEQPVAPEPVECVTAFIIYQLPDGRWQAADDLDTPLVPARKPVPDEIYAGCSIVLKDALAAEAAITSANLVLQNVGQAVVQAQMQVGQQMAQARQAKAVQEELEKQKRQAGRR
jgi:hypothetical protein